MPRSTTTASPPTAASATLAAIDRMIELAEQQVTELSAQSLTGLPELKGIGTGAGAIASPTERLEKLELVAQRLRDIKEWLTQDPSLVPLVDDCIGQQVRDMEQRKKRDDLRLAGITTVVGAILGWLVSLLGTPQSLLHLFGH